MKLRIESTSTPDSTKIVHDFLTKHYTGVLATADAAATPHAAAVYYTLQDDFTLLFGTKRETQKFRNIEENNQVAFIVYEEQAQSIARINGRVEVVEDSEARQKVLNNMFKSSAERSLSSLPPAEKLWAGDYVAMRIIPSVISLAIYARPESDDDTDLFETVVFSE